MTKRGYIATALVASLLSGCATTGYLTADEDVQMREMCGEARDCMVVSGNTWRQIQRAVKMCGLGDI